jgi:hypothetical protein
VQKTTNTLCCQSDCSHKAHERLFFLFRFLVFLFAEVDGCCHVCFFFFETKEYGAWVS